MDIEPSYEGEADQSGESQELGTWEVGDDAGDAIATEDPSFDPSLDTDAPGARKRKSSKPPPRSSTAAGNRDVVPGNLPPGIRHASALSAATTLAGVPVDSFGEGMRVTHPQYGYGVVHSVDGFGPKRMARIGFDSGELRSFQLSKSPLAWG
jgi:hypothetical protein